MICQPFCLSSKSTHVGRSAWIAEQVGRNTWKSIAGIWTDKEDSARLHCWGIEPISMQHDSEKKKSNMFFKGRYQSSLFGSCAANSVLYRILQCWFVIWRIGTRTEVAEILFFFFSFFLLRKPRPPWLIYLPSCPASTSWSRWCDLLSHVALDHSSTLMSLN